MPPEQATGQGPERWLLVRYSPVSFFSLRLTHATNKGGKTLLVPTPYATKMALLDACFRRDGPTTPISTARRVFDLIKSRDVRFRPPIDCVVQNTFIKILDQSREPDEGPFRRTIAYREFVFFSGELCVALAVAGMTGADCSLLDELFAHINSLGKRGSFWQYLGSQILDGPLPLGFTMPEHEPSESDRYMTAQMLDDFGDTLCLAKDGFDRVSTYGDGSIRLGEHRVLRLTRIPYRRHSASRSFTWYQRLPE